MAAGQIAKPQMRRLFETQCKKAIINASILSVVTGVAWFFGVMQPRKKQYADFYKTYDDDKAFKIMCEAGLLQSCDAANCNME